MSFLALIFSLSVFAQNSNSIASGPWNAPATWLGGIVPDGTNEVYINSGHIVTLVANTTTTNLLSVVGTLAMAGFNMEAGSITGSGTIRTASGTPSLTIGSANGNFTFSGIIGPGALVLNKTGTGIFSVSADNTYTGNTNIQNGSIRMLGANAFGTTGTVTVSSGAQLQLEGTITVNRPITINGTGVSSDGAIRNNSGTNALTGTITLASASSIVNNGGTLSMDAATAIAGSTFPLTLGGTATTTVTGIISGSGLFTKEGTGTVILTATNSFSGNKVVAGGAINVQLAGALGAAGTITVNSGAALQIQGGITFARPITINGTGVGGNTGAIRNISGDNIFSGTITLGSASRIHSDAGTCSLTAATAINGSGQTVTFGGNATVNVTGVIGTVAGAVIKENNGTAIFGTANTYTGGTTITTGFLTMRNASALGTSGTITVSSGGTLQLENNITVSRVLNINGVGASTTGAIRSVSGTNIISSTILMATASRINVDAGTLTLSNVTSVSATNQNLTVGGASTLAVSGALTIGSGTFTKDGNGTCSLAVASTFTGNTTISAGIVTFAVINAFGTTGTVSVTGSGSLHINGNLTFARPISISSSAALGAIRSVSGTNILSNTVTLTGNSRINTDAGTLTLSNVNSITGTNQTLTVGGAANTTFSGTLTQGTGGLTKDGAGTATLAVANSFTGTTTVTAGSLVYGTNNILATGNVTVNGGTLNISTFSDTVGTITVSSGSIIGSGTLYSTVDFSFSGGTISTILGGSSGLIKTGTGTLTLTGANTFTGQVWIQNGTVSVASINRIVGASPSSNLGAPTTVANGTILLGQGSNDGTLLYTGTGESSDRRFELAGGNTGDGSITNNGTGALVLSGDLISSATGTSTFFLRGTNTGNNFFSGEIQENTGLGTTAFSKQDAGTWILDRSNGYLGSSTIGGGILQMRANGALGQGTLITVSGGSLQLAPTAGVLTLTQDFTISSTGVPANAGAITNINGNNTLSGIVSISGTARINSNADSLLFTASPTSIRSNNGTNRTFSMGGSGHLRIVGDLEHGATATFTKDGSGALVLTTGRSSAGTFNHNLGLVKLGTTNALNTATFLNFANAVLTFDLNGLNHTLNGIAGSNTGSIITSSVAGNCTLTVDHTTNRTLAARIENGSGTMHLSKLGTAELVLSNTASTFSGQVHIGGGRLTISQVIANTGTNSSIGTGNTTAAITLENGGILGYTSTTARSSNRPFAIIGSGTISRNANTANALTLSGAITGTNANLTLEPAGGTNRVLIVNSIITLGTGTLTQTGTGTTTLGAANSYTGNTIINQGTLTIGNAGAIPSGSLLDNTATLNLNGNNITVAGITGTAALAEVRNNIATAGSITVTSATGDLTYSGRIINGTGVVSVVKAGAYTQRLGGNNTYTGATTINAGVFKAVSATAISSASAFTVANVAGATLDIQGFNNSIGSLAGGGTTGGDVLLGTATLSLGSNNSSTSYAGTITGVGTGGIEKVGSGTFTFDGTPAYPGLTIVTAGTFRAGGDLVFEGVVSLNTGGLFDCNGFQSSAFYISFDNLRQVAGSWGSLASAATNKNNTFFTNGSTGILVAVDGIQNGYWLGTTSSDWFTTTNWHNGHIPRDTTRAVIEFVATNAPNITGTATCGNIEIFPDANLTITGTNVLDVHGDWLNYGVFTPNSSTVNFRKASGVTQVITRPTFGPFANLQYFGTGTLRLSSNEPLPFEMTGALITSSSSTIDVNGKGLDCAGLAGPGTITNSQPFDIIIAINGTADQSFSGILQNGTGTIALTKTGSMVQTLEGNNTFSGGITISGGEFVARTNVNALGSGTVLMNGTTPVLRLSNTAGVGLNFARPITVSVPAEIITDNNSSGAGAVHTLGTLTLNTTALTINGGANITSGVAGVTFGAVTHGAAPTYTVNNPLNGGETELSLGTLTGGAFLVTMAGDGNIVQTGAFSIAPALATQSAITYQGSGTLTLSQANTMTQRLTLTSGNVVATNNAGALGSATTVYLSGGILTLRNNTGLAFNNAVNITTNATIITDVVTPGAGVNHTLGAITYSSLADSLRVTNGANITSGIGSVTAGLTTLNRIMFFNVDTLSNLTLTGFVGNFATNKLGTGQLTLSGNSTTKTTAATTLTAGILRVESANGLANGVATLNIDGGQLVFANNTNTTFTGTNILLRAATSWISVDRTTAAGTETTHTVNQISWNASNLELLLDRGANITGAAFGNLQPTTLVQNTNGRVYNYNVLAGARFRMPSMTLTNTQTVNFRGQGEVGQSTGAALVTVVGTTWNQLGSGSLVFSGNNSLVGPITIDSGEVRTETVVQTFRTLNINNAGRFHPVTINAFALSMFFNGTRQAPRLYGSQASTAQFRSDTLFAPGSTGRLGLKGYLEFITQPIGGRSSLLFASPPVVELFDSLGVLINNSSNTSPVFAFLSRTDATGRGRLRGDSVELMVNDRATFDSLRIGGRVDSIYRIAFIVDSLVTPAIESGNITVSPGPIDPILSAVVFSVDTAIANGTDSVIVSTTLLDIDSNVIANELVTLTQDSGKNSVIVAENFSYSNANGFARFAVSSTVADSINYFAVIEFGDDEPFTGSAKVYFIPGPPFRLSYLNQPYSAPINTVFFPPIRVAIYDSNDNQMWTDTNVVNLRLFPFSFIDGGSPRVEDGGLAEFPLVSIANGGTYIMTAWLLDPNGDTVKVNSLDFDIIENYYTGGNGDGHFLGAGRKQNLAGKFVITMAGDFVARDKFYDGTSAVASGGIVSSTLNIADLDPGFTNVTIDSVRYTFLSPGVGDNKRVIIDTVLLGGADTSQYIFSLFDAPVGVVRVLGQSFIGGNGRGDVLAQSDTIFLDGVKAVPTKIVFDTLPGDQLANNPITLRASIRAANDRIVPFGAAEGIVSFFTNPGSATLGGTTTQPFTNGRAIFSDLNINRGGLDYQLGIDPVAPLTHALDTAVTPPFDVYAIYSGGDGRGDSSQLIFSRGLDGEFYEGWVGGDSGNPTDWYTAANWSSRRVPLDTSRIIIANRPNQPSLLRSGVPAENGFLLASAGTLTFYDNSLLRVDSGTIAADGPRLIFADGSTVTTQGNSRIVLEPNSRYVNRGSSQPRLEVKQELKGVKGWRLLTSPVLTSYADFLDSLETQGYPGSKYDSLQPNMLWWAETDTGTSLQSWRQPANAADSILPGRGHYVYVFNGAGYPASVNGGGNYRDTLPITLSATGYEPNMGGNAYFTFNNLTFTPRSLSTVADTVGGNRLFLDENVADEGWNLLGNPTPSVLNWDATSGAWDYSNIDNTVYIWDPSFGNGTGGYRYWNGNIGNINDTTLERGLLAPYQAFWVHANAASPVLRFNNDAKTDSTQRYIGRTGGIPPAISFSLKGEGMEANSYVSFDYDGITGPDSYDAYQLEAYNDDWLMLYTNSSTQHRKPLVINHLPAEMDNELAIPLHLAAAKARAPLSGNFTLEWELTNNWPANWEVALMDHHKEQVIPMVQYNKYNFSYNAPVQPAARTTGDDAGFRALNGVLHSADNLNTEGPLFRQQREPVRPFTIVVIPNHDGTPITYRPDHAYLYPPSPNPFVDETRLSFYLPVATAARIEVIDLFGRTVLNYTQENYNSGTHEMIWKDTRIKPGTYIVRLITDDFVSTQKAVKVR